MQPEAALLDRVLVGRKMEREDMQIDNARQQFREQTDRWSLDRAPMGNARDQHRNLQELPHNAHPTVVRNGLSRHFTGDSRDDCHVTVEKQ
jgi:hypothetical protein